MKALGVYIAVIVLCYFVAWTLAFAAVNGGAFAYYFQYLAYFWTSGGGERPAITGVLSLVLTIPFAWLALWRLRRH